MTDPNQPYIPQPYPKALYRDHGTMRIVNDDQQHAEATAEGFVPFEELPERPADDLEYLNHDQLVEVLVGMLRKHCQARSRDELLELARVQRDIEVHNAAVAERQAKDQAAIDEAVVALGGEPGETPDHVLYGHSSLPETVVVGGAEWSIGEVIGGAFGASGLTEDAWNALETASRDELIKNWLVAEGWTPDAEAVADDDADSALPFAIDAPVVEPVAADEQTAPVAEAAPAPQPEEATPDAEPVAEPLDHDEDGKKGGAVQVSEAVMKLRADLDVLGVPYDKRWREGRLLKALDEATKG